MSKISNVLQGAEVDPLNRAVLIRRTLAIFLPVFALIAIGTGWILYSSNQLEEVTRSNQELHTVSLQAAHLNHGINEASADLAILIHGKPAIDVWDENGTLNQTARRQLSKDFLNLIMHRQLYSQVRLLDLEGKEVSRIDLDGRGYPKVISKEELQNKKDRYYFEEMISLQRREIYVSPFDLNVERGEIEIPFNPLIRFGALVFDRSGNKRGMVLLNYIGENLLDSFSGQATPSNGSQAMLVNADGYWLRGPNSEDEWAFMFEDRKNTSFANSYPGAWKSICDKGSCQFETAEGLFTAKLVLPLLEGHYSDEESNGSDDAADGEEDDYSWKIISFVPASVLYAGQTSRLQAASFTLVLFAFVILWGAWRLAEAGGQRKRSEVERKRLMAAIEQAAETIVITDSEAKIQYVNPAFERITGFSCQEAIGESPSILKSEHHDRTFYEEMWGTITNGETWRGRIVNRKKDGSLFSQEASISPVKNAEGNIVNYVAVKSDITQEIRLEGQLRQSQKMEAVGQLAGGVAHDFNNLLQAINGYSEMALVELDHKEAAHGWVSEVSKAGKRATTLVRQLLAFSRRQVLEMKDVDLNLVITDLLSMVRRVIGEDISLKLRTGADTQMVRADPGQMEQILMNLCLNARDAMPAGGTITIQTQNVTVDEVFCQANDWATPGEYVLLSVTDTGCGMDKATLANVFEPFFTTKGVGEGTGLGLSTVFGLVKQHKGKVQVRSEIGKGTSFRIFLPVASCKDKPQSNIKKVSAPTGSEAILLVEDDDAVLALSKACLERAGYQVLTAINGVEALDVYEEYAESIELILLDVVMPKLGGRAVYERIHQIAPDVRFLFASGYSPSAIHTDFVLNEGLILIQKPFSSDALLLKVREVLDADLVLN